MLTCNNKDRDERSSGKQEYYMSVAFIVFYFSRQLAAVQQQCCHHTLRLQSVVAAAAAVYLHLLIIHSSQLFNVYQYCWMADIINDSGSWLFQLSAHVLAHTLSWSIRVQNNPFRSLIRHPRGRRLSATTWNASHAHYQRWNEKRQKMNNKKIKKNTVIAVKWSIIYLQLLFAAAVVVICFPYSGIKIQFDTRCNTKA